MCGKRQGSREAVTCHQREFGSIRWFCISLLSTTQKTTSSTNHDVCYDFVVYMKNNSLKAL